MLLLSFILIIGTVIYYESGANTALELVDQTAMPGDIEYEQIENMFLEENKENFTLADFEEFREIGGNGTGPNIIQQNIVLDYGNQKIVFQVTPGLKNMKILDIEITE